MPEGQTLRGVLWEVILESLKPAIEKDPEGTIVARHTSLCSGGIAASLLRDFLIRHATDEPLGAIQAVQLLWRPGNDPTVRLDDHVRLEVEFDGGGPVSVALGVSTPSGSVPWQKLMGFRLPDQDGGNVCAHFTGILDGADRRWRYFHCLLPLIVEEPPLRHHWWVKIWNESALFGRFRRQTPSVPKSQSLKKSFDGLIASCLYLALAVNTSVFLPIKGGAKRVGEWTRGGIEEEVYGIGIYSRRAKTYTVPIDEDASLTADDSFADVETRLDLEQLIEDIASLTTTERKVCRAVLDNDGDLRAARDQLEMPEDTFNSHLSRARKKLAPYRALVG